jgi:hypothetical protein
VYVRNGWAVGLLMVLAGVGWLALTFRHATAEREALPRMGPAPEVSLTTQDGQMAKAGVDALPNILGQ